MRAACSLLIRVYSMLELAGVSIMKKISLRSLTGTKPAPPATA
jgi:hypothetical protein